MNVMSPRVRLTGFNDAAAIERVIGNSLIDIAYVDEIAGDTIFIVPDIDFNFGAAADFEFVKAIIVQVVREILNVSISVDVEPFDPSVDGTTS